MIKLRKCVEFIALMLFYIGFSVFGITLLYAAINNHINTEVSYKCVDGKHIIVIIDKRRDYITEETLENVVCD